MRGLLIIVLCAATSAFGANHYIREGASGSADGSDWVNAWTDLPVTFVRGDTYYVADGTTYGGHTFNTAESGTDLITITKATAGDHGTGTGWSSAYGDGQALFTGTWEFDSDYWTVDGVSGGGPGDWEGECGFKIYYASSGYIITTSNVNHITLKHVDVDGPDRTSALDQRGLYGTGSTYITISYCRFTDSYKGLIDLVHSDNVTIEYSKIGPNGTSADEGSPVHSFGISIRNNVDFTIRYNLLEDISETGYICLVNDSAGEEQTRLYVYGNVFFESRTLTLTGNSIMFSFGRSNTTWTNCKFYNNVIANLDGDGTDWSNAGFYVSGSNGGGNEIKNNIWYNCSANSLQFPSGWTADYNYYNANVDPRGPTSTNPTETNGQIDTGNPFTDMADFDFSLVSATDDGDNLASPFDEDWAGNTRGADDVWDRGAYEFSSLLTGRNYFQSGFIHP